MDETDRLAGDGPAGEAFAAALIRLLGTLALLWVALFGLYPLADPGHDDLGSPLVWLDLVAHGWAVLALLEMEVQRRVRARVGNNDR